MDQPRVLKLLIGSVVAVGVVIGLTFAYLEGRKELERERERERPVSVPPRVSRSPSGDNVVTFDAETRKRAALTVAVVVGATRRPEVKGFGTVLDPTPLVVLWGELQSAEATLANSTAQVQRARTLSDQDLASHSALDAAEAQFRVDQVRVEVTRSQVSLEWGEGIARLDATARADMTQRLLGQQSALLRVDLPVGENTLTELPSTARVVVIGHENKPITASVLSVAPAVNSRVQGQGIFLRADTADASLRPGAAIVALLATPGKSQSGVDIPSSAIVRFAGSVWVYVQIAPDTFTRREVFLTHPTNTGWFVKDAIKPGDQLVIEGEQALLSEELKSQIQVGEEHERE